MPYLSMQKGNVARPKGDIHMTHHIATWQFDPKMTPDHAMRDTGGRILDRTAGDEAGALVILREYLGSQVEVTGVLLADGPDGYDQCYYPVVPEWIA